MSPDRENCQNRQNCQKSPKLKRQKTSPRMNTARIITDKTDSETGQRGGSAYLKDGAGLKLLREAGGVLVFVPGEDAKEVAVDEGAKGLGAVAVVAQAGGGKDGRP